MKLIDTHCHLYVEEFKEDIDSVIANATNEGVEKFYLPAIDSTETEAMFSIEKKFLPHLRVLKTYLARRSFNARFTSQYSVRLYEWAWQHRRAGLIRITLDELRRVLGVNESRNEKGVIVGKARLTLWPNLKQRALMRAVNEITKKSDLTIKVVTYGREKYRKVTAVAFQILEKAKETVGS